jgi:hypothetical protein
MPAAMPAIAIASRAAPVPFQTGQGKKRPRSDRNTPGAGSNAARDAGIARVKRLTPDEKPSVESARRARAFFCAQEVQRQLMGYERRRGIFDGCALEARSSNRVRHEQHPAPFHPGTRCHRPSSPRTWARRNMCRRRSLQIQSDVGTGVSTMNRQNGCSSCGTDCAGVDR